MNLKKKNQKKIFLLLLITTLFSVIKSESVKCAPGILLSLGLDGFQNSKEEKLEMCPMIQNSCCRKSDQLKIYQKWIVNEEGKNLKQRFDYNTETYSKLLLNLEEVIEKVGFLYSKLQGPKNCKILSQKILQFKMKDIAPKIKNSIRNMYEFFHDSYKGFYCSVCNADFQTFINVKKKKFILAEQFCRNIVVNSLHVLIYFHVDMVNYLNLISRFITNCDLDGDYKYLEVDKNYLFNVTPEIKQGLYNCKAFRNDPEWFAHCSNICYQFSPTTFNEFFEPHVFKINQYNRFIQSKLDDMKEKQAKEDVAYEKKKKTPKKSNSRILTANTEMVEIIKVPDTILDLSNDFEDREIFTLSIDPVVEVDDFKINYVPDGLNFYEIGKSTIIDHAIHDKVKIDIKADQEKMAKEAVKKEMDKGEEKSGTPEENTNPEVEAKVEVVVSPETTEVKENAIGANVGFLEVISFLSLLLFI